jgi:CDP-diacylglycerol--serine O-phosphatidyltransferase
LCNCKYKFISQKIQNNSVGLTPLVGLGGNNNKLNQTILNLIDCANKEIFICTPYFNLPAPVLKKIRNALKRNIQITIIIGDKTANDFYIRDKSKFNKVGAIPYIYEMNLKDFIESNSRYLKSGQLQVNLWKNENNTYHVKGLMIDNKYHLITGNNINPRAWALDLENGILIHDKNMLLLEKFSHEKLFFLDIQQELITPDN